MKETKEGGKVAKGKRRKRRQRRWKKGENEADRAGEGWVDAGGWRSKRNEGRMHGMSMSKRK